MPLCQLTRCTSAVDPRLHIDLLASTEVEAPAGLFALCMIDQVNVRRIMSKTRLTLPPCDKMSDITKPSMLLERMDRLSMFELSESQSAYDILHRSSQGHSAFFLQS